MLDSIQNFLEKTGIALLFGESNWWQYLVMYVIVGTLMYLAIVKKFEPLLLMPIAFGMLLANLPGAELIHLEYFFDDYYVNPETGTLAHNVLEWFTKSEFMHSLSAWGEFNNGIFELFDSETLESFKATLPSWVVYNDGIFTFLDIDTSAIKSAISAGECTWINFNDGAYTFGADYILALEQTLADFPLLNNAINFHDGSIHVNMAHVIKEVINAGGLLDILYLGVKLGVYPSLIFLGVGAMTDFSPLIANPKSLLMGAGAQLGVFVAFFCALFLGFTPMQAGAIGIIGGADGPTAILVTKILAPELLGAIAIAAYSYMALIPIIQPPFMRLFTTESERKIKMSNLRPVSQVEKVIFPIVVTAIVCLIIPDSWVNAEG